MKKRITFKRSITWQDKEIEGLTDSDMHQVMTEVVGQDEMLDEELTIETFNQEPKTNWWVADLYDEGGPILEGMDGPHDTKEACQKTIALMESLKVIKDRPRVILEITVHEGTSSQKGLNQEAINTLNSHA